MLKRREEIEDKVKMKSRTNNERKYFDVEVYELSIRSKIYVTTKKHKS